MSANVLAARFVLRHATDRAEAREFLLMLGLLTADGRIAPDNTRTLNLATMDEGSGTVQPGAPNLFNQRPPRSTAPEGLRNLAPIAQQPRVPAPRKPRPSRAKGATVTREPARCGTDSGYKRHRKNGEASCAACREAHTVAARKYNGARGPRSVPVRAVCGTPEGCADHRRRHETVCDPCRVAHWGAA